MTVKESEKEEYVKWYRLAEKAIGNLVQHPREDAEILKWVSREGWLLVPTHLEKDKEKLKQAPHPHIFFFFDNGHIRMGLTCNSQESIRKMRNILHKFHTQERAEFLDRLRQLDNDFATAVLSKEKPHHHLQTPEYHEVFKIQTNKINDRSINRLFQCVDEIREEGRTKKAIENSKRIKIFPMLDLAWTRARKNEEHFLKKMSQLKPLYEICLKIRTDSQIGLETKKRKKTVSIVKTCPKCGVQESKSMFCPRCGLYLSPKEVTQDELERIMKRQ